MGNEQPGPVTNDARPAGEPGPDDVRRMSDTPGPDPAETAGLQAGSGVDPGDTPPSEGSMSGAAGSDGPNMGPVSGNRTPMIIALSVLAVIVLMVAIFVGASFYPSN